MNNKPATPRPARRLLATLFADYGMLLVLILLGVFFSVMTWDRLSDTSPSGLNSIADTLSDDGGSKVILIALASTADEEFTQLMQQTLESRGHRVVGVVNGKPADARKVFEENAAADIDTIVCSAAAAEWLIFKDFRKKQSGYQNAKILAPPTYYWPAFLTAGNLRNVASQISVIAIIAIGMTLVIITGGIDLSVGSLIALSAVISAYVIRSAMGGVDALPWGTMTGCMIGIAACGLAGLFNGVMVTWLKVPPFIVTLALMLALSGFAYIIAGGQSIDAVPEHMTWLGRGATLFGIPNSVILMLLLYAAAHLLMSYTIFGRYIYAVGGNAEAARLSGVPVTRVVLLVYTLCGALAGLGGVVMASQLKSGAPTYGQMYELYVIAAVVVGGASLAGGEGKVLGTLIGAFIIAVIQNGMNLTNVESYTQKVVLGSVILGAVILDRLRHGAGGWKRLGRIFKSS